MTNKHGSSRSFPGRLTLDEWIALPDLGRREMIHRAVCTLLECERFCTNRMCQRHRSCCGDDAAECERRLRRLPRPRLMALQAELGRLEDLASLRMGKAEIRKDTLKSALWNAGLYEPWNAPANPPWAPAYPARASAGPAGDAKAALGLPP
jgi:hypothetical protein